MSIQPNGTTCASARTTASMDTAATGEAGASASPHRLWRVATGNGRGSDKRPSRGWPRDNNDEDPRQVATVTQIGVGLLGGGTERAALVLSHVPDGTQIDQSAGERKMPPTTVEPLDSDVLAARPEVKRAKRRAQRLARPAYVNTDASWHKGQAGLAYDSWALGQRIELVRCEDNTKAEHMALLMAMEDAERALTGAIAFRVDSTAVANWVLGKRRHLKEVQDRIKVLLKRHPDWSVVLIEGYRNRVAHSLSRRPFQTGDNTALEARLSRRAQRTLIVPAELVECIRRRLYTVLGIAAGDVARATEEGACITHPELLTAPRRRYKEVCSLLDVVGWSEPNTQTDVKVDLRRHAWALASAIEVALAVADDSLNDLGELDDIRSNREASRTYETTVKRATSLRDLVSAIANYNRRTRRVPSVGHGELCA